MPDGTPNDDAPESPGNAPAKEPLPELTLGRARPSPDPAKPHPSSPSRSEREGEALVARCRAKAEAARWAAERQRRIRERDENPDEGEPADPELRRWAETLTDAYYWSSTSDPDGSAGPTTLDEVGGCFETLAAAIDLVDAAERRKGGLDKALPLLAEAQSAVRRALQRIGMRDDPDQLAAYEQVRQAAARHRIFLKRFLRADDLAEPSGWPGLLARIEARAGTDALSQGQRSLLQTLDSLLASGEESWREAVALVERLVADGLPPSSRELRDVLLPVLDDMPEMDDPPPGVRLVLREIDRYLATRAGNPPTVTTPEPTTKVREAARLLSGRSAVLIGGVRRPQAQEMLRTSLGLHELVWIATREHQAIRGFEATIARPEVAVVLLAIRWSSHSFGDVKQFCDRHGKSLVRLPGGYNPAQAAAQILAQCSGELEH